MILTHTSVFSATNKIAHKSAYQNGQSSRRTAIKIGLTLMDQRLLLEMLDDLRLNAAKHRNESPR
jgi:hypothetical protein